MAAPAVAGHIAQTRNPIGSFRSGATRGIRARDGHVMTETEWITGVRWMERRTEIHLKQMCGPDCPVLDCVPGPCPNEPFETFPVNLEAVAGCDEKCGPDSVYDGNVAELREEWETSLDDELANILWSGSAGSILGVPYVAPPGGLLGSAAVFPGTTEYPVPHACSLAIAAARRLGHRGVLTLTMSEVALHSLGFDAGTAVEVSPAGAVTFFGHRVICSGVAALGSAEFVIASGPVEYDLSGPSFTRLNEHHGYDCGQHDMTMIKDTAIIRFGRKPAAVRTIKLGI